MQIFYLFLTYLHSCLLFSTTFSTIAYITYYIFINTNIYKLIYIIYHTTFKNDFKYNNSNNFNNKTVTKCTFILCNVLICKIILILLNKKLLSLLSRI